MPMRFARALNKWWSFLPLAGVYIVGVSLSASLWFDPGLQVVTQGKDGVVMVTQERVIHRDFLGEYHVIVRDAIGLDPICEGAGGQFTYRKNDGAEPAVMPLKKWTGGGCDDLPAGTYTMETCWTVLRPFFWALPPKTVCVSAGTFEVTE